MTEKNKDKQVQAVDEKKVEQQRKKVNEVKSAITESLGLAEPITDFLDGKTRMAYPATLSTYGELMDYVMGVSLDDIPTNYFVNGGESLKGLLQFTFRDDPLDKIMDNIGPENYVPIMKKIYAVHGFDLDRESPKGDSKNS